MKFTCVVACLLVSLNCAEKAAGTEAQTLFSADYVWLWWVAALVWGLIAVKAAFLPSQRSATFPH